MTKNAWQKIKSMERGAIIFVIIAILCAVLIAVLLRFYFAAYQNPHMEGEVFDLSEGWQYETSASGFTDLASLRTGPRLPAGETMTLYRALDADIPEAAILIRANHQAVNVYVDSVPLLNSSVIPGENPGMALHFLSLPEDYARKTLRLEITSPYSLYSGRTSPVLLGTVPSLEAYALSASTRSFLLMAVCLALGIVMIVFALVQGLGGAVRGEQLALGVFAVVWSLYYVCTEYVVFQFFSPLWVSRLSLGLYFTFPVPLTLFFYFSFTRYRKWMLPAVILHAAFPVTALALQLFGVLDLPRLVNINNIFLAGLAYTIVLTVMEAVHKNRLMTLTAPFLIIAYGSMLYNFGVFYSRRGVVPYSYRDTYFLLILAVLVFSVWRFFREAYRQRRENEMLSLQKRLAEDSYEQIKTHIKEVSALKHDMNSHFAAMRTYLEHGRAEEARAYLARYAEQAAAVTETAYSEHLLMNAIAGNLYRRAAEHGIKLELDLAATPAHIADPDLYSLLANLTDNAVEACANVPEGERFIRLAVTKREPYLSIRCENSKSGEILGADEHIETTKTGSGHGYGLAAIRRVVEAYDGMMCIEHDETTFTVMAALKDR